MTRPVLVSTATAVVVAAGVQAALLVLAPVAVLAASVVAGVVLALLDRPDAVREVALPAVVVGVAATVAAMLVMASRGSPVLEGRYLSGWVVLVAVSALVTGVVAMGVARMPFVAR